ncbi:hypothetical protein P40081_23155 [Paenibacillus sp. FSL P4-0081]|nr:hypothetical protein P40081_23155 [Paenibacillus sp. FSL P4-0081]
MYYVQDSRKPTGKSRLGEAASSLPRKADKRGNSRDKSSRPEVQLSTDIKDWYYVKTLKFSPYSEDALKI